MSFWRAKEGHVDSLDVKNKRRKSSCLLSSSLALDPRRCKNPKKSNHEYILKTIFHNFFPKKSNKYQIILVWFSSPKWPKSGGWPERDTEGSTLLTSLIWQSRTSSVRDPAHRQRMMSRKCLSSRQMILRSASILSSRWM